jgi:hypothetical protein
MVLKFIDIDSKYFEQATDLRISAFFQNTTNPVVLINDLDEEKSFHLAAIDNGVVVGIGRLTYKSNRAVISQMAVAENVQRAGLGSEILRVLIQKSKEQKYSEVFLSAREKAIIFYQRYGFKVIGKKYPSKKTGIIHVDMIKTII